MLYTYAGTVPVDKLRHFFFMAVLMCLCSLVWRAFCAVGFYVPNSVISFSLEVPGLYVAAVFWVIAMIGGIFKEIMDWQAYGSQYGLRTYIKVFAAPDMAYNALGAFVGVQGVISL